MNIQNGHTKQAKMKISSEKEKQTKKKVSKKGINF